RPCSVARFTPHRTVYSPACPCRGRPQPDLHSPPANLIPTIRSPACRVPSARRSALPTSLQRRPLLCGAMCAKLRTVKRCFSRDAPPLSLSSPVARTVSTAWPTCRLLSRPLGSVPLLHRWAAHEPVRLSLHIRAVFAWLSSFRRHMTEGACHLQCL